GALHEAAVVVGVGVVRVEANRLVEVGQRRLVPPEGRVGQPPVEVGQDEARVVTERLVEVGDGPLVLLACGAGQAAGAVRGGRALAAAQRLRGVLTGADRERGGGG